MDNLNLCTLAIGDSFWLQNKLPLIPFEVRVLFYAESIHGQQLRPAAEEKLLYGSGCRMVRPECEDRISRRDKRAELRTGSSK